MGQTHSFKENLMPSAVDNIHLEIIKHVRVFSEIASLNYEEFKICIEELNKLSRMCLDEQGKQLLFVIKKGTDSTVLWKATVQVVCVKIDPSLKRLDAIKVLNLKQFLCVFKTFQSHISTLTTGEENGLIDERAQFNGENILNASRIMDHVQAVLQNDESNTSSDDSLNECCICLDRKTEVLLPCAHTFCCPCIEQWNVNNKTCPVCCEELKSTDDTWVLTEVPGIEEINEKICCELNNLTKSEKN